MRNLRKLGMITLSTGLTFGILTPAAAAASPANEQVEKFQIRVASTESVVSKSELIKKFKDLFPTKFNFLNDDDFYMSSGHHYPDDDTIRYNLSFHKEIKGKQIYGDVGFFGEELEIESFYYQPANSADALFPAKVTKEEAEKAAKSFLSKLPNAGEYQLSDQYDYYQGNQTLTEPIRYSFSFVRTENQVPISDQVMQVTVLGNGEITNFYRNLMDTGSDSYDDVTKVLSKEAILAKVKENFSVDLRYTVDYDYQSGDRNAQLVYQPRGGFFGVHALTGEWQTVNGFSPDLPEQTEISYITEEPIQPEQTDFTLEKAKAFAQELLAIDSDKVELTIESIDERENYNGQEVISVQYMYHYENGGYGAELELDKQTGEIIQYYDIKSDVLRQIGEDTASGKPISSKAALDQAVKYLKEFSPSNLHNYAKPMEEAQFEDNRGYHLTFPRVVDNIPVIGDQISVSISSDGSLLGLNVNHQDVENWPSSEDIISEEQAKTEFLEQLNLDLQYVKEGYAEEDDHYHLAYTPVYNNNPFSFLNANTGEWNSPLEEGDHEAVLHPWAEDELNYLLDARILDVEDVSKFNPNAEITKGEAIEVLMKSLTYFYDGYYPGQENMSQSFENIDPEHPLYHVIERAVELDIIDTEKATFDLDEHLTREELSVWFIRALGLEKAAENGNIYQLDFADAKDVQDGYEGYVALAHSLELLTANQNQFNPDKEVTYAQLAVSVVRLAHEVYERNLERYY